eukprot:TRINITY_DN77759_c0_g1_i1.p1 TRINITY_DN77759_c0_g1~~TRINITY_DN77759_c0_g1_i1.p1  ORF type:complete len:282 (+),score=66.03 TRINITY_DN77759_c0_g1_i1:80-925(+)
MPGHAVSSLLSCAKTVLGYYFLLLLFLVFQQRSLIFQRPSNAADPSHTGGQLVRLSVTEEEEAVALYFPAVRPEAATFAYFHGNADQLGWGPASLGRDFGKEHGLGFYGVEYPGYGYAQGTPTEESIMLAADRLLKHLTALDGLAVPQEQVILFGQSIGCAVALEMATRGFGGSIVLLSPFTSLHSMAVSAYPFIKPAISILPFMLFDRFDNLQKVEEVRLPALVLHGTQDEIVPFAQGEEIAKKLHNSRFRSIEAAGHNDVWADHYGVKEKIVEFLAEKR